MFLNNVLPEPREQSNFSTLLLVSMSNEGGRVVQVTIHSRMKWVSTHGERREHIFIIGITWCVSEECVPLPGQTSKLFGFLQCKFAKQLFHRNLWLHIFSTFQVLITWLCILKMCMFTHEQSKVIPNDCSLSNTYNQFLYSQSYEMDFDVCQVSWTFF